jgi:hypothetical protein
MPSSCSAATGKYVHDYVLTEQLADCRSDLEESGVHFDVWFSEAVAVRNRIGGPLRRATR